MKSEYEIKLWTGEKLFGSSQVAIYPTWRGIEEGWILHKFSWGYLNYRSQIAQSAQPPIMVYQDLFVHEEFRNKGLGSAGMAAVMNHFLKEGAGVALLRIATQGEDWKTGKVWRQKMYEKLGWSILCNHDSEPGDVPIMWHPLQGKLIHSFAHEIRLDVELNDPWALPWKGSLVGEGRDGKPNV